MATKTRNAQKTRGAILSAARRLFSEQEIAAVSIRDIAHAAGVSHGLVQQYFGTREQMIAAIIQDEVEGFARRFPPPPGNTSPTLDEMRNLMIEGRSQFHDYAMLVTRAQLAGIAPEKMLDPETPSPALIMAAAIRHLQSQAPAGTPKMDPLLVSAYINAMLFAFETLSPWLMTSVGLKPADYGSRYAELADISVKLIALASGADPHEEPKHTTRPGRKPRARTRRS